MTERTGHRRDALTELIRDHGPTETTLDVLSTAAHSPEGRVVVNGEKVAYTGVTATSFTGCTRGVDQSAGGAPPSFHRGGSLVRQDNPDEIRTRKGGVAQSVRPDVNFVDTASVAWTVSDDPINKRTNIQAAATGIGTQGPQGEPGPAGPAGPTGETGPAGRVGPGVAYFPYLFSLTTTAGDPGPGFLRLNNSVQNTASVMYIDDTDTSGAVAGITTWGDGTSAYRGILRIESQTDPTRYLLFYVSNRGTNAGYQTLYIYNIGGSSASPFGNAEPVYVSYVRNGDKGDTGAQGVKGDTGAQGPQGGGGLPVGSVIMYAGAAASVPSDCVLADGRVLSRTTYSVLFGVIGTTYGAGDGSTTFNVPNLKSRFPLGLDAAQAANDALGETGGARTVTLTANQSGVPAHTHGYISANRSGSVLQGGGGRNDISTPFAYTDPNTAQDALESHENMPPFITLNFIIKALP